MPPRVLVVLAEHWPRALLRAQLIERGWDAVGAERLDSPALLEPAGPQRGPVRALLVDAPAADEPRLARLLARHGNPPALLLAGRLLPDPPGPWRRVLRRPITMGEVAAALAEAAGADT